MREIKFRAWDKKYKQMQYVGELNFSHPRGSTPGIITDICIDKFDTQYPIEEYILMQYTGLKDKNGVEIYADDLMQENNKGEIHQIEWMDSGFWNPLTTGASCGCCDGTIYLPESEVVGNIYENPELLKNN